MAENTQVESPAPPSETTSRPVAPPAPPPTSRASDYLRARPHARIFIIIAVIVVIVGGILAWRYFSSYESTDDAEVDGHLMPVSARISGYVAKVDVDDNQIVKAGDTLVEIDPRDFQVALDQARAAAADAQATADSANINIP